jgi:RNA polymerase sporulation-specific sigma factor
LTEANKRADDALIAKAQEGVSEAEEALVEKYAPLVRRCARPYFITGGDTEDLFQEGMMGLLSAIRHYRLERGASFRTYAELCIRRRIYSAIRKFALPVETSEEQYAQRYALLDDRTETRDPESMLIDKEKNEEFISGFFKQLSRLEQTIVKLYLKGEAYRDIAERTGRSIKSVDNAIQRVKHKLRSAGRSRNDA